MENLKKLAVLISGLGVIALVIWMVSLFPAMPNRPEAPRQKTVQPFKFEEAPSQPQPEHKATTPPGADSLRWQASPEAPPQPQISGKAPIAGNPNPIFISAAQKILPAVVSIENIRKSNGSVFDFFHPFLKRDNDGEEEEEEYVPPGSGSGIIISRDGYILTNNHVVEDTKELRVKLFDKREYIAELVGTDPTTDIAVIRIRENDLPAAYIGNSDNVQIGEWVMAVGNPLNFTSTVTSGIVSALGRNINIIDGSRYRYKIENFIQTDAVINPGNSGGALVNLNGEVIGINTAIATRSGYYQGYGFSIPINLARKVSEDLINFGYVRRAILGVSIEPVTDQVAKAVGLPLPSGAMIQGVTAGSPAQEAGIQQGDIILKVNGKEVVSVNDLQIKVAQHHPGEKVVVSIWRNGELLEIPVILGEAPPPQTEKVAEEQPKPQKYENFGLTVRELTADEKKLYGVDEGLMVEKVLPNSPAARAGIYRLDIILQIDDTPVNSVSAFQEAVAAADSGDFVKFLLRYRNSEDTRIAFIEVQ
jgi:serine protease Do